MARPRPKSLRTAGRYPSHPMTELELEVMEVLLNLPAFRYFPARLVWGSRRARTSPFRRRRCYPPYPSARAQRLIRKEKAREGGESGPAAAVAVSASTSSSPVTPLSFPDSAGEENAIGCSPNGGSVQLEVQVNAAAAALGSLFSYLPSSSLHFVARAQRPQLLLHQQEEMKRTTAEARQRAKRRLEEKRKRRRS